MEALVDDGLVRNIGVSNFEIDDLERVRAVATKPIAVNQVRGRRRRPRGAAGPRPSHYLPANAPTLPHLDQ
eukprot:1014832-Prymnesium_polylepis.1